MMKKLVVALLVVVMAFAFTACKKNKNEVDDKTENLTEIIDISEDDGETNIELPIIGVN